MAILCSYCTLRNAVSRFDLQDHYPPQSSSFLGRARIECKDVNRQWEEFRAGRAAVVCFVQGGRDRTLRERFLLHVFQMRGGTLRVGLVCVCPGRDLRILSETFNIVSTR
jgi:hypothetical protein